MLFGATCTHAYGLLIQIKFCSYWRWHSIAPGEGDFLNAPLIEKYKVENKAFLVSFPN